MNSWNAFSHNNKLEKVGTSHDCEGHKLNEIIRLTGFYTVILSYSQIQQLNGEGSAEE